MVFDYRENYPQKLPILTLDVFNVSNPDAGQCHKKKSKNGLAKVLETHWEMRLGSANGELPGGPGRFSRRKFWMVFSGHMVLERLPQRQRQPIGTEKVFKILQMQVNHSKSNSP